MNNKYKSLVKDTVIFGIGSLGSKVILFFLVPLYTNFLTTEEYGIAELVSTFTQLIVPFSAVVINQALIRFGMKKTEKPEDVVKASFVVLLFSVAITILLAPLVGIYSPLSNWKWYLAMQVIFSNFSEVERSYLKVKGRNEPVRIYEILQTKAAAVDKLFDIKDLFEKGLSAYRKQHWDTAEEMFRQCNEKYQDMPSVVFLDRISHFKTNPPPKKWDGVFEMRVK